MRGIGLKSGFFSPNSGLNTIDRSYALTGIVKYAGSLRHRSHLGAPHA